MLLNIKGKLIEIDLNCVDMINFFNNENLDTKSCCEGHVIGENFNIMFENYISDDDIINFIERYSNKFGHSPFYGKFMKWARKCNGIVIYNWMYIADVKTLAKLDYKIMIKNINNEKGERHNESNK